MNYFFRDILCKNFKNVDFLADKIDLTPGK